MTTTTIDGPALPELLAPTERGYGAHMDYGKRIVSWTVHHGDGHQLYRNDAAWAWLAVSEEVLFAGEPLYVRSERRAQDAGPRASFTDAARKALHAAVVPAVARYGFDRWWTEVHRRQHAAGTVDHARHDAHNIARWHDEHAELVDLYAAGVLEVIPGPQGTAFTTTDRDARRTPYVEPAPTRIGWASTVARLMLDGEHVGWLTDRGQPIPHAPYLMLPPPAR